MQIIINGVMQTLNEGLTLAKALRLWGYHEGIPFAVAINEQVIPKEQFRECLLTEGSKIEILTPMQGG